MPTELTRLTLNVRHLNECLSFYKELGFSFQKKTVALGGDYHMAVFNGVEFCLFERKHEEIAAPNFQFSFKVRNVDELVGKLLASHLCQVILAPQEMPDGRKAIVLDPDEHSVELMENR